MKSSAWLSAILVIAGLAFASMGVHMLRTFHKHQQSIEAVRGLTSSIKQQNVQLKDYLIERDVWLAGESASHHEEHDEILKAIEGLK